MIEFVGIFIYFLIALALAMVLVGVSFLFATRKSDPEKISAYECGFDPFDDARSRFDIQFYLVAILFLIFDRMPNLVLSASFEDKISKS